MKRRFRLTRTIDFQRVRRRGKSFANPLVVLMVYSNTLSLVRIGVAASQAVGKAVERNKAKRRLRACVQQLLPGLRPGWDLVLLARKRTNQADFSELCHAIRSLLIRAEMLDSMYGN
ncbi:MAG: ribonuclease P protein component [Anaerolineaceae bacterium]|nr:ribonuclease P protein component [Anaerolineaceae bacterium]